MNLNSHRKEIIKQIVTGTGREGTPGRDIVRRTTARET